MKQNWFIVLCLLGSIGLPGCGATPRNELPVEKSTGRLASTLPAVDMEPITQLPLRYERIGDDAAGQVTACAHDGAFVAGVEWRGGEMIE